MSNVVDIKNKDIEYKVPEEMEELMDEHFAALICRDKSIDSFWHAKRAITYGKVALKSNRKFWRLAKELYPDVADDSINWSYNAVRSLIIGRK